MADATAVTDPGQAGVLDAGADAHLGLLLALGDDELILGQRHSHWTGVAPHLEEDMAFSSIAQDEIGHALAWFTLAAERTGLDADRLGLGRDAEQYRHAELCDADNGDWGSTTARHLLYDLAEDVRLETLSRSSWTAVADTTGALRREERYHLLHARAWLDRLATGPAEARRRLAAGLEAAYPLAVGLFEALPGEAALLADGTLPESHAAQRARWDGVLRDALAPHGLDGVVDDGLAPATPAGRHGRHGRLTDRFALLWQEMTALYRDDPAARW